jgi:hypothetical protein
MREDDEVIAAYERELDEVVGDAVETEEPARRGGGRGFWIVAGALVLGSVLLVGQIFANRPVAETIAHAQKSLRIAQAEAESVLLETGSFDAADAHGLSGRQSRPTYREADDPSTGLDDVSVSVSGPVWAAAVLAAPGACFYLRLEVGVDPLYGAGAGCTGTAALGASEPRW